MKKLLLTLLSATLAIGAIAQTPATEAKPKPLSSTDKSFVKNAGDAILLEQKYLALMAGPKMEMLEGTTKDDVEKINDDLKRMWAAVSALASLKTVELSQDLSKSDLAKVEKLGKEKPDKFGKEFFKDLSKETKKTAKLFESSKTLQDADVKKFAEDWASTVKEHDVAAESGEKASGKKK